MSLTLSETLQDADVLIGTVRNRQEGLAAAGVTAAEITGFAEQIEDVRRKETLFQEAQHTSAAKTKAQDVQIAAALALIKKFQNVAKIVYYGDKQAMKEFLIGQDVRPSVKTLTIQLESLAEVAGRRAAGIKTRGITDSDIAALVDILAQLRTADSEQENALKTQTTVVSERDAALAALKVTIFKMRKSADVAFADNKSIRDEFKSIFPSKRKKKTATAEDTGETTPAA